MPTEASTQSNERRYPIIYVRGFAFSADERDDTAADPYCGFNVGSSVYRASANKERPRSYMFESPVVRLANEHDYNVIYEDGLSVMDPAFTTGDEGAEHVKAGIPLNSIIIHRFYDSGSNLLGNGKSRSIDEYARELGALIATVRRLVRPRALAINPSYRDTEFRCYLVAHSMGGLVVRALLQNAANEVTQIDFAGRIEPAAPVRGCVAKVFTYATPHNGIEFAGLNVPEFLGDVSKFNRDTMRQYLDTVPIGGKVNYLPPGIQPPPTHWFTMVGTNRLDYEVAHGASRTFVGRGSDGLVRIDNATLWYQDPPGETGRVLPVACAYAYRSHSGAFGIVNSMEAYQNLRRFLFGDCRVDLWLDIESATLPDDVQKQESVHNRRVDAVYQIELVASPRGKPWALSRRKAEEDSPACRTYQEIRSGMSEPVHLSTVFLMNTARVNQNRPGLSYAVTLGVKAPDYEVDRAFWKDGHYEGVSIFRDSLIVTIYDPVAHAKFIQQPTDEWLVRYHWLQREGEVDPNGEPIEEECRFSPASLEKPVTVKVPLYQDRMSASTGRIEATLRMEARVWA
ncbi:conserved hypothetical protein [Acidovorax delafieldii 2AN]|uniref:DUF676 domain-containing protein n=1 Tax=Acidovorax delafieldii 2AN TaxID=573060 RepID=C5T4Q6_ACIDE|nr:hypothetical protein [Acidovorax delafieldii]EER60549.1 conserved hypothetical protein [Acidovorax delafieldii 2AN]